MRIPEHPPVRAKLLGRIDLTPDFCRAKDAAVERKVAKRLQPRPKAYRRQIGALAGAIEREPNDLVRMLHGVAVAGYSELK